MSNVVGHITEFPPSPRSHPQHAGRDPIWKGMTYGTLKVEIHPLSVLTICYENIFWQMYLYMYYITEN